MAGLVLSCITYPSVVVVWELDPLCSGGSHFWRGWPIRNSPPIQPTVTTKFPDATHHDAQRTHESASNQGRISL